MSDLLVFGLKLLFLALLWLFVLFAANVIRSDLFGRPVEPDSLPTAPGGPSAPAQRGFGRRGRTLPSSLRVTDGPQAGLVLPLGEAFLIGRTHESQLVLDDQFMSTQHARITRARDGYVVEDLGSTNGTYVNDRPVQGPTPFGPGDSLRIGRTTMTLDR